MFPEGIHGRFTYKVWIDKYEHKSLLDKINRVNPYLSELLAKHEYGYILFKLSFTKYESETYAKFYKRDINPKRIDTDKRSK